MFITTASSNLLHETEKSVLVQIEDSHYKFWIAKKMVRETSEGEKQILVPDHWQIKVFVSGEDRQLLEEKEISAQALADLYESDSRAGAQEEET